VTGVPSNYGGLTFKAGDPNTILIGGGANGTSGELYAIAVTRDGGQHISGFSGTATVFAAAAYNDGGVVYGPGGVLFLARWPVNQLGETKSGSSMTDKIVDLGAMPLDVTPSPGGLNFVPPGYAGAGQLKAVSYNTGNWYTLALAADGSGTYDVTASTLGPTITGGPEGFVYVPPGSPDFTDFQNILVSEYGAGVVSTYTIDTSGDPVVATRAEFITGLTGAEGAQIDPVTGDFLFSTFGGGNHVIAVQGFAPPPTTTTSSSSTTSSTTVEPPTTTSSTSISTTTQTTTTRPTTATTSTTSTTTARPSTTTTAAPSTTTTTTLATECGEVPDGPTFASVICRLEALLAQVNAESRLGNFQVKLAHTLMIADERATDARDLCAASNAKKSKKRLAQAKQTLGQYVHRLGSKPARKLDDTLRRTFLGRAQFIVPDVDMLRKSVQCPVDASR
jgi:hypothetical protein